MPAKVRDAFHPNPAKSLQSTSTICRMTTPVDPDTGEIDYDLAIMLDAEDLAEQGLLAAYRELAPHLVTLGMTPGVVTELIDSEIPEYSVTFDGGGYPIFGPGIEPYLGWGLATFALFDIVNRQLSGSDVKLYAINGGNDLLGIFMTPEQAELARKALPNQRDWPYLPTPESDWFGMHHD
jgi:hypothetical protein